MRLMGQTLTFTAENWATFQRVTIAAASDADAIVDTASLRVSPDAAGWSAGSIPMTGRDSERAIVLSSAALTVGESSGATVSVRLGGAPEGNVVVNTARTSGDGDIAVSAGAVLTFTPANWNVEQTILLSAVSDVDRVASVTASSAGWSSAEFTGAERDDDVPGVVITQAGAALSVSEAGATDSFSLRLAARPTADVTIALVQPNLPATPLDFSPADYDVPRLVASDAGSYTEVLTTAPTAPITPELAPADASGGVVVRTTFTAADWQSPRTLDLSSTSKYTAVITSAATATVMLAPSGPLVPNKAAPTFTPDNWSAPQTVTLVARNDGVAQGKRTETIEYVLRSADADYARLEVPATPVTIMDDDTTGFVLTNMTALVTSESGGMASFRLVLTSVPKSPVVLALRTTDGAEGTLDSPLLVFNPADALVPQVVTIRGVDDTRTDGGRTFEVVFDPASGADPDYRGKSPSSLTLVNLDDDTPGIFATSDRPLVTTESGGAATIQVVLTPVPTSPVVITLAAGDASEGKLSTTTPTFTPENALEPQLIMVTGVDDVFLDGFRNYLAQFASVTSADPNYAGRTLPPLTLINQDNESGSGGRTLVLDCGADRGLTEGDPFSLSGALPTVKGPTSDLRMAIDWGDGAVEPVAPAFSGDAARIGNTHRYADEGTYIIGITLVGADVVQHDEVTAVVGNAAPIVTPLVGRQTVEAATIVLNALASDPGPLDGLSYLWRTVSNNGRLVPDIAGAAYSFTPVDNGRYALTLIVTDDDGGRTEVGAFFDVLNLAPTVNLSAASSVMQGDPWSIGGSTFDAGADALTAQVD